MSLTPNILVSWGMTNSLWSSSLRMGLTFLLGSYGPGLSEAGPGVNRDGISSEFAESSSKTSLERSRLRCGHWNNLIRFPLSHLESVPEAMFKTEFKARPEKEKTWIKRRIVFSPMITWFLLTTLGDCYKKYKFKLFCDHTWKVAWRSTVRRWLFLVEAWALVSARWKNRPFLPAT